ncbi:MAG: hypothetical protein L0216_21650, partial [Planctomycetales bacterium]|nr:hypothetical protein [Planctomycetales bacterium]
MRSATLRIWTLAAAEVFLLGPGASAQDAPAPPGPVELACVADTSICLHEAERDLNQGGKRHLRLKGIQHILLLDFDWKPLAGRTVTAARLVLRPAGPLALRTLGLSTVATRWVEGEKADESDPAASCTRWPGGKDGTWAGPGTDFLDACFTAGGTIAEYRDARTEPDGSLSVEVPPDLIHACLSGRSFGLAVSDEKGQTMANNDFRSREDGAGAVLRVVAVPGIPPATRARALVPRAAPRVVARDLPGANGPGPGPLFRLEGGGRAWLAPAGGPPGIPPSAPERDAVPRFVVPRGGTLEFLACTVGSAEVPRASVESPDAGRFRVSRLLSLSRNPGARDPLVPLEAPIPAGDGSIVFHLEASIPAAWEPRLIQGFVRLDYAAGAVRIPFEARVATATLRAVPRFQVSLNTYGRPGEGDADELQAHRIAHEHRATLTPLPYSQSGQLDEGAAPARREDGTWDWEAWDARYGPLLTGEAFANLPRGRVPLDHLYLPLHENWPLPIAAHYPYKGPL